MYDHLGEGSCHPRFTDKETEAREGRERVQVRTGSWSADPSCCATSCRPSAPARGGVIGQARPPLMPSWGPLLPKSAHPTIQGLASVKPGGIPRLAGLWSPGPPGMPCPQSAPFKVPVSPLFPYSVSTSVQLPRARPGPGISPRVKDSPGLARSVLSSGAQVLQGALAALGHGWAQGPQALGKAGHTVWALRAEGSSWGRRERPFPMEGAPSWESVGQGQGTPETGFPTVLPKEEGHRKKQRPTWWDEPHCH